VAIPLSQISPASTNQAVNNIWHSSTNTQRRYVKIGGPLTPNGQNEALMGRASKGHFAHLLF
jgi:hypothetical protein